MESGSVILDQLRKEEEEASTLTLTFHRSSPSPPFNLEYPPNQIEFFHKLLGFPENIPETPVAVVTSPMLSPAARELVASPATSTASMVSVASPQNDTNKTEEEAEEDNKEIYHAADPSKSHLGYFCLCGLECSTKKTLQYHLQYLQSNTSSSSTNSNCIMETDTITHINMIPVHYPPPPQNQPITTMKIKKCKRCGESYTGGKEGLRQHNLLLHHHNRSQQPYSLPVNDIIPSTNTNTNTHFACDYVLNYLEPWYSCAFIIKLNIPPVKAIH